ncbi:hypothetical protein ACIRRA_39370 [Nocardia sp. NPDC101769]|uniref:hypothetical protein n=1 Tax=Nocardia sp. NPDC101769 TaxID=3364333 RepID=UPI0038080BEC
MEIIHAWAHDLADAAGPGWRVEAEPQPPCGWNLIAPDGAVKCSGSLDQIEAWLIQQARKQTKAQKNNNWMR